MKKILRYTLLYIGFGCAGWLCASCSDFFETDSDAVLKTDGQRYEDETAAGPGCSACCKGCRLSGTIM